jgi:hypothetical protein
MCISPTRQRRPNTPFRVPLPGKRLPESSSVVKPHDLPNPNWQTPYPPQDHRLLPGRSSTRSLDGPCATYCLISPRLIPMYSKYRQTMVQCIVRHKNASNQGTPKPIHMNHSRRVTAKRCCRTRHNCTRRQMQSYAGTATPIYSIRYGPWGSIHQFA